MTKEAGAQIGKDALADPAREIRVACRCQPTERSGTDEDANDGAKPSRVAARDSFVDGQLGEQG